MMPVTRRTRSQFLLIVLASTLAACGAKDPPKVEENLFPADYKKAIVEHVMVTQSFDPTNIREAAISEPALKPVPGNVMRYAVCLRFNARNVFCVVARARVPCQLKLRGLIVSTSSPSAPKPVIVTTTA